jgi:hypothetical protein
LIMDGETPFSETNALIAVDAGDEGQAREWLADYSASELLRLWRTATRLADLCRRMAQDGRN